MMFIPTSFQCSSSITAINYPSLTINHEVESSCGIGDTPYYSNIQYISVLNPGASKYVFVYSNYFYEYISMNP